MAVLIVIKKIGEKVLSVVEFPFKYGVQIEKVLTTGIEDAPEVKAAVVGLVQQFEAIEPDALAAIAADGLNVPDDLKCAVDFKSLFAYVKDTLFPAIEGAYKDVKTYVEPASSATGSAGTTAAAGSGPLVSGQSAAVVDPGEGLHNQVPA